MTEFEHEKKSLPEPDKTPVDPLMEARAQAMAELAQLSSQLPNVKLPAGIAVDEMGMIVRTLALATKVIAGQAETADNSERKSISTDDLTKAIKTIDQKIYYPYGHYHPVIRALLRASNC